MWITVMFYQLFGLSFWRHPFTAEWAEWESLHFEHSSHYIVICVVFTPRWIKKKKKSIHLQAIQYVDENRLKEIWKPIHCWASDVMPFKCLSIWKYENYTLSSKQIDLTRNLIIEVMQKNLWREHSVSGSIFAFNFLPAFHSQTNSTCWSL